MAAKWIRLLFFCILYFPEASAMSYPDSILFKSYGDQYSFRKSLMDDEVIGDKPPQEAVKFLNDLQRWAENKDDRRLQYGFLISKNFFILGRKLKDTSRAEASLLQLIPELENDRMYELKAEALQDLARYYWERKKYPEAFEKYIYAYGVYNKFNPNDFPGKSNFLSDFGGKYYVFADYENATRYTLEAYRAIPDNQKEESCSVLNTLGLCYMNLGKYDSAEYYYARGYKLAVQNNSGQWKGIISGNLGYLYLKQDYYDKALPWFQKEIEMLGNKQSMNVANSYAILSTVYVARNEKEKAMEFATRAYDILRSKENYNKRYESVKAIYMALAKAYAANGDMERAYKFLDSGMVAKDSVEKKINANVLAGIRHKISANERLLEHEQFEKDARNSKMIRYILIAGMVLLVIITILLINRQKLKYSFSRKQLEAEKQHIESELEIATSQLNTLVSSISDKNELIEKFNAELNLLREHLSDEKLNKADEALTQLQKATIITDEEWEHFSQTFEKVNKGFLKRLNAQVRGLSPIETKFLMLSKMKLSTNQVAAALGISQESVRLNRKRLYTKLNLAEGEQSLQMLMETI